MDYLKEARKAQKQGDLIRAGDLYVLGGSEHEAINMYLEGKSHSQAARLLEKQENWRGAAQCYSQAGNFERAARMYANVEDWDKAGGMLERHGDLFRASEMYQKAGNLQKAAELADKADKWERAAPLYEKAGNLARAADLYFQLLNRHLEDKPEQGGLLESQRVAITKYGSAAATLYSKLQNHEKAAQCFEKAENQQKAGECWKAAGQFQRAAEAYISAEDFHHASEMLEKIAKFGQASEMAEKAKEFERAAELASKAGQSTRAAALFAKTEKFEKAADLYFQLLMQCIDEAAKSGKSAVHRANIQKYGTTAGTLYKNAKNYAKAGWCFEQAGQVPMAAECFAQTNLQEKAAELFVQSKNYEKAYELLLSQKEIQNRALLAEVLFHKGQYLEAADLYSLLNQPAKAAECYEKANQFYKAALLFEEVKDFARAAALYSRLKEPKKAAELYEKVKDFRNASLSYEQAGNLDKAAECALASDQKLNAARLLAKKGESQKAVALLQHLSQNHEDYTAACLLQGSLLLSMGMHSMAAKKLEEALGSTPVSPENLEAYYDLATALQATEQTTRALKIFQSILSIQFDYRDVLKRTKGLQDSNENPSMPQNESIPSLPLAISGDHTRQDSKANTLGQDAQTFQVSLEGKKIREYEILEVLGKGGMGTVYRARHVYLDKERAIKVVRSALNHSSFSERFIREARILSDLHHPNLVQLFEFGSLDGGAFFMVLEFIQGESVKARMHRLGRIPIVEAIGIIREAAMGLQKAHEKGIIHRDISPDNLMLVPEGGKETTKVIDFGIAKAFLDKGEGQTMTNTFIGKPEYASPEQCGFLKEGENVDARSDIYSLAVTLHTMIAGTLPFKSPSPQGYLVKHMTQKPQTLSQVVPDAPPALDQILQKGMNSRREKRHSSMEEFLKEINTL